MRVCDFFCRVNFERRSRLGYSLDQKEHMNTCILTISHYLCLLLLERRWTIIALRNLISKSSVFAAKSQ